MIYITMLFSYHSTSSPILETRIRIILVSLVVYVAAVWFQTPIGCVSSNKSLRTYYISYISTIVPRSVVNSITIEDENISDFSGTIVLDYTSLHAYDPLKRD